MKTLSGKLRDILFGDVSKIEGGIHLRGELNYPTLDGLRKYIYWEGNLGLIATIWQKIEKLENEIATLKSANTNNTTKVGKKIKK